jgi:hypothetical protein
MAEMIIVILRIVKQISIHVCVGNQKYGKVIALNCLNIYVSSS